MKGFFYSECSCLVHDIGYYRESRSVTKREGAQMAEGLPDGHGLDATVIEAVKNCILATKLPKSLLIYWKKLFATRTFFTWERTRSRPELSCCEKRWRQLIAGR